VQGKSVEHGKVLTEANVFMTGSQTLAYLGAWLDGRREDGGAR
jgi:hypothetical protein